MSSKLARRRPLLLKRFERNPPSPGSTVIRQRTLVPLNHLFSGICWCGTFIHRAPLYFSSGQKMTTSAKGRSLYINIGLGSSCERAGKNWTECTSAPIRSSNIWMSDLIEIHFINPITGDLHGRASTKI